MYFLYKYEYGTFKLVEITIRRGLSRKENNGGGGTDLGIIHIYKEM
jgi:hypothetical protein